MATTPEPQGSTFGGYEVARRLGSRVTDLDLVADIYVATHHASQDSQRRFLVHVLESPSADEEAVAAAQRQIERYRSLKHDALPAVLKVFTSTNERGGDSLIVVMPYEEGVRLDKLRRLLAQDKEQFPDPAVWFVGWRLFGALAAGHLARDEHGLLMPLIHGSLSMQRMLVTADGELRVHGLCSFIDYDEEEEIDDEATQRRSIVPQAWWAPEVREGNTAHPPSDVYSAALILRTLLAGLPQPIPGAPIQALAEARPDLPRDIIEALDRAVLRSPDETPPTAADLSARFEGLVRVSDGKKALRGTMDLHRAIGGLFDVSSDEAYFDEGPPSVRGPSDLPRDDLPVDDDELDEDPRGDVVLRDSVLDDVVLEQLGVFSEEPSPESLQILDEATSDIAAEVDDLIALESDDPVQDDGVREPIPASMPLSLKPYRRPTPPPLPTSELLGLVDETEEDEEERKAPEEELVSEEEVEALDEEVETFDPDPLSEIPATEDEPFSEIPQTEDAPQFAKEAAAEPLERPKRTSSPIELNRLAVPVLRDGDDLDELGEALDDTQPDIDKPVSETPPSPFLEPNALLQRAQDQLDQHADGPGPKVEVTGHFEVAGDPKEDAIGEEVARVAPKKRYPRTLDDARRARDDPYGELPSEDDEETPRTPLSRPPVATPSRRHADPEEGGMARWAVFLAVAISVGVAAWYGSRPKKHPLPVLSADPVAGSVAPSGSVGETAPVMGPPAPCAAPKLPPAPTADPDLEPTEAYLVIASSVDAEVVLKGKVVGSTNEKNRVLCGKFKHVRLRNKNPKPHRSPWLTVGESLPVPCRQTTTHTIEPDIAD